jgi:SAM-dependent methyltransferase
MANLRAVFEFVYSSNLWGSSGNSGPGSSVKTTIKYRRFLTKILKKYKIKTVLDFGCGKWEHLDKIDWRGISYTGVDVVPEVIEFNKEFETDFRKFLLSPTEIGIFDLVIIKDVFQHLSFKEIFKVLELVSLSKYFLITNDGTFFNVDIKNGDWRPLNMGEPPFNFNIIDELTFESIPFTKQSVLILNKP